MASLYVDGKHIATAEGLKMRTSPDQVVDSMVFHTFFGGSGPTWAAAKDEVRCLQRHLMVECTSTKAVLLRSEGALHPFLKRHSFLLEKMGFVLSLHGSLPGVVWPGLCVGTTPCTRRCSSGMLPVQLVAGQRTVPALHLARITSVSWFRALSIHLDARLTACQVIIVACQCCRMVAQDPEREQQAAICAAHSVQEHQDLGWYVWRQ